MFADSRDDMGPVPAMPDGGSIVSSGQESAPLTLPVVARHVTLRVGGVYAETEWRRLSLATYRK